MTDGEKDMTECFYKSSNKCEIDGDVCYSLSSEEAESAGCPIEVIHKREFEAEGV